MLADQEIGGVGSIVGALVALLLVQHKRAACSLAASATTEIVLQGRVGGTEVDGEADAAQVHAAAVVAGGVHTPVVVNNGASARAIGGGELMQVPAATILRFDELKAAGRRLQRRICIMIKAGTQHEGLRLSVKPVTGSGSALHSHWQAAVCPAWAPCWPPASVCASQLQLDVALSLQWASGCAELGSLAHGTLTFADGGRLLRGTQHPGGGTSYYQQKDGSTHCSVSSSSCVLDPLSRFWPSVPNDVP